MVDLKCLDCDEFPAQVDVYRRELRRQRVSRSCSMCGTSYSAWSCWHVV